MQNQQGIVGAPPPQATPNLPTPPTSPMAAQPAASAKPSPTEIAIVSQPHEPSGWKIEHTVTAIGIAGGIVAVYLAARLAFHFGEKARKNAVREQEEIRRQDSVDDAHRRFAIGAVEVMRAITQQVYLEIGWEQLKDLLTPDNPSSIPIFNHRQAQYREVAQQLSHGQNQMLQHYGVIMRCDNRPSHKEYVEDLFRRVISFELTNANRHAASQLPFVHQMAAELQAYLLNGEPVPEAKRAKQ